MRISDDDEHYSYCTPEPLKIFTLDHKFIIVGLGFSSRTAGGPSTPREEEQEPAAAATAAAAAAAAAVREWLSRSCSCSSPSTGPRASRWPAELLEVGRLYDEPTELARLTPEALATANGYFGGAVALAGTTAVVGAPAGRACS